MPAAIQVPFFSALAQMAAETKTADVEEVEKRSASWRNTHSSRRESVTYLREHSQPNLTGISMSDSSRRVFGRISPFLFLPS